MTTEQLLYIQEISRHGSLSDAARNLNISQSTLSKFLQSMEKETGAPLFVRVQNKLTPTVQGYILLDMANQIELLQTQMIQKIHHLHTDQKPVITIGFPYYWKFNVISKVISTFSKRYPGVLVQALETRPDAYPDLLKRNVIQLAVSLDDYGTAAGLQHILLKKADLLLAVPGNWLEGEAQPLPQAINLPRLEGRSFILPGEDSILAPITQLYFQEHRFKPDILFENGNPSYRLAAVNAGIGYTVILEGFEESLEHVRYLKITPHCQTAVSLILTDKSWQIGHLAYFTELLQTFYEGGTEV